MYLKRARTPKTWPIKRKGTKYVVVPSHNLVNGVPLLIIARELLGLGNTRREVRKALLSGGILVNGKQVKRAKYGLSLNDTITLKSGENYRLTYSENRKFALEKISPSEANEKISKVVGKKILKGKKIQISTLDGRTAVVKSDIKIGSSAVIDLKSNEVKKVIPLGKGSEVLVISGKHIGGRGKITEDVSEGLPGLIQVTMAKKKLNLNLSSVMALK